MKKKMLKIILILGFLLIALKVTSEAAISASSQTVNSGETLTISVNSDVALGAYTVTMTSSGGLEFISGSGMSGTGKVISGASREGVTNLATYTFKAPSVESTKTYKVTISATGMEKPNMEAVSNSTATATITVKAKQSNPSGEENSSGSSTGNNSASQTQETKVMSTSTKTSTATAENQKKSNNADLKKLTTTPTGLNPKFSSTTTKYTLEVKKDVTEVKVTAVPEDEKSTVKVLGNTDLKEGTNHIRVVVTAEDGTTKTYQIDVNKETENTILTDLKIKGATLDPEFSTETYEYTCHVGADVTYLEINTELNKGDGTVEITGNENFKPGENIVTIKVKSEEGEETYTYTIKVMKEQPIVPSTTEQQTQRKIPFSQPLFLVLISMITLAGITCAILEYRHDKKEEEEIEFEEDRNDLFADPIPQVNKELQTDKTESMDRQAILDQLMSPQEAKNKRTEQQPQQPSLYSGLEGLKGLEEYKMQGTIEEIDKPHKKKKGKHF